MSVHKAEVDQERANMLKSLRAFVRLRHSINADNELNVLLPKAEAIYNAAINRGKVLSIAEVKRSVGL